MSHIVPPLTASSPELIYPSRIQQLQELEIVDGSVQLSV